MKALVIGSGGREHALAWKLAQSTRVGEVIVAPGNAGTAIEPRVRNVDIAATDIDALATFAAEHAIDLGVVGPEAALAAGVVDAFRERGLRIFGPTRAAAGLETSKAYAKDFMRRHAIATAGYRVFDDASAAHAHARGRASPIVVKADGLAAGKGVVVAEDEAEAHAAIDTTFASGAGSRVVIEEFLDGEEASFIAVCDGRTALPLATSQDHKRLLDGDRGPNTGGMGAFSPAPVVTPNVHARVMKEIVAPTLSGMAAEGRPFTGFLYVGLMIDASGAPRVVEFNTRLGDPEAQVLLMRLQSDLFELLWRATGDGLDAAEAATLTWDRRTALGVVMASAGYPSSPRGGDVIRFDRSSGDRADDVKVFHAGTARHGDDIVTSGGRVLCVTALGESPRTAAQRAARAVKAIDFAGAQWRSDIGHRAIALRSLAPRGGGGGRDGIAAPATMSTASVRDYLLGLQSRIVAAVEAEGERPFGSDRWRKEPGEALQGDGNSRLVEGGAILERGGCGFSHVQGKALPAAATQHRPDLAGAPFEALGVSLVFHPRNPYAPTVHMNVRMVSATPTNGAAVSWFGGGMDLTPYYGFEEDAIHFHAAARKALLPFGADFYARSKRWCDDYFFLKHRNEPRGIGGVFFDDYTDGGFENGFELMRSTGDAFIEAYLPILRRRRDATYGDRERDFQHYRRGRYVEFNLVWDRGTHFGLQSGGRTESILMSMPPVATWRYDWRPEPGSAEERLYRDFLRPRDWLAGRPV